MGLLESEVAIFAFDGVELDSGTVVEFMFAKFLDIPCVVYRTDFRGGSGEEATEGGDSVNRWNLMVSYYPRTKIIYMNGMVEYQKVYTAKNGAEGNASEICEAYCEHIAHEIMQGIEEVRAIPALIDAAEKQKLRENAIKLMGMDCPQEFLERNLLKKDEVGGGSTVGGSTGGDPAREQQLAAQNEKLLIQVEQQR